MWAIGEIDSLLSVKVSIRQRIKNHKKKKYKKKQKEIPDVIRSGKIKLDINPEKQNRHSLNHSLYLKNKNFALKIMKRLPSYTTLSINELNRLVQQYSTSGKILINKNGFNHKK